MLTKTMEQIAKGIDLEYFISNMFYVQSINHVKSPYNLEYYNGRELLGLLTDSSKRTIYQDRTRQSFGKTLLFGYVLHQALYTEHDMTVFVSNSKNDSNFNSIKFLSLLEIFNKYNELKVQYNVIESNKDVTYIDVYITGLHTKTSIVRFTHYQYNKEVGMAMMFNDTNIDNLIPIGAPYINGYDRIRALINLRYKPNGREIIISHGGKLDIPSVVEFAKIRGQIKSAVETGLTNTWVYSDNTITHISLNDDEINTRYRAIGINDDENQKLIFAMEYMGEFVSMHNREHIEQVLERVKEVLKK